MKFNKDSFLNEIVDKVQSAIDKNLITQEDVQNNDVDRLHGFIQYELLNYIEDRKFAIDVLKDFNFDERKDWKDLQAEYGEFRSLMDIALVNLWKYLESEKATEFSYYSHDTKKTDNMLDLVHDKEDFQNPRNDEDNNGKDDGMEIGFDAVNNDSNDNSGDVPPSPPVEPERPRRKIRISRPE